MPIIFEIQQHSDCWSFRTTEHGLHMGYPDVLQATAAAMRAFDPDIKRIDALVDETIDILDAVKDYLDGHKTSKPHLTLVSSGDT